MAFLESTGDGVRLELYVQPRASRSSVVGLFDGRLKIRIAAVPAEGEANEALKRFLARELGVTRSAIQLVSGHSSRRKVVSVEGVTVDQAAARLVPDQTGG